MSNSTTQTEIGSESSLPSTTTAAISSNLQECRLSSTNAVVPSEAYNTLSNAPGVIPSRRTSFADRIKSIPNSAVMATAKFKSHFHTPHGHRLFRTNSSNLACDQPVDEAEKQKDKDFINCYQCNGGSTPPRQLEESPKSKELGFSSKQLRVGDFELIKTIGTGMLSCRVELRPM